MDKRNAELSIIAEFTIRSDFKLQRSGQGHRFPLVILHYCRYVGDFGKTLIDFEPQLRQYVINGNTEQRKFFFDNLGADRLGAHHK